ncbi:MAG TPA: sialidase family protein [Thermoanaerobaculia bacterium]|nr:sialidase family protein [Thermoanaerobaculia bacterium]
MDPITPLLLALALNPPDSPLVATAPIFHQAPFAECHASTLVETSEGALVAAWFGGTEEGHPDVGIWLATRDAGAQTWSEPRQVAADRRHPTWNPVLFQPRAGSDDRGGPPLLLFYKVGPSPDAWWGMLTRSTDGGRTWARPQRLRDGALGPIRSKPLELDDGYLLCGSSTEHDGWRIHFELTRDHGRSWRRIDRIAHADPAGGQYGAIQPTLLRHPDGRLQALTRSRQGRILTTWSANQGRNWSPLVPTVLPNPSAGVEGLTLRDTRHLLVYNHTTSGPGSRARLNVALSEDGESWAAAVELENQPGEYSYPAAIQTRDGLVHVTYTWRRQRIQHAILDPARFDLAPMPDGEWPASRAAQPAAAPAAPGSAPR